MIWCNILKSWPPIMNVIVLYSILPTMFYIICTWALGHNSILYYFDMRFVLTILSSNFYPWIMPCKVLEVERRTGDEIARACCTYTKGIEQCLEWDGLVLSLLCLFHPISIHCEQSIALPSTWIYKLYVYINCMILERGKCLSIESLKSTHFQPTPGDKPTTFKG